MLSLNLLGFFYIQPSFDQHHLLKIQFFFPSACLWCLNQISCVHRYVWVFNLFPSTSVSVFVSIQSYFYCYSSVPLHLTGSLQISFSHFYNHKCEGAMIWGMERRYKLYLSRRSWNSWFSPNLIDVAVSSGLHVGSLLLHSV